MRNRIKLGTLALALAATMAACNDTPTEGAATECRAPWVAKGSRCAPPENVVPYLNGGVTGGGGGKTDSTSVPLPSGSATQSDSAAGGVTGGGGGKT